MMAQREQRLVPERVIGGKYRIIRLLGEGGMGGVYEAENELTRKRVAIKWLHPSLAGSRDAVQRLLREAQACARVRHPNVVDVYDVGQEDDAIFLVMEYLEGETFRAALLRDLPLEALIELLIPAMRGVAAVHAKGIVHRDIKPDNIFLARVPDQAAPVPKVLDFGISKVDARQGEMETLTQSGVSMGTPLYMSFEQLTGAKDADARADIYAFGVMLYEAATGRPPFEADSFGALAVKVATTEPKAPRAFNTDVDPRLEALIMKAMARERNERFATLEAMIAELEPFGALGDGRRGSVRPRPSGAEGLGPAAFARTMAQATPQADAAPTGRPARRALAALVLVLAAGVAALAYLRAPAPSRVLEGAAPRSASEATGMPPLAVSPKGNASLKPDLHPELTAPKPPSVSAPPSSASTDPTPSGIPTQPPSPEEPKRTASTVPRKVRTPARAPVASGAQQSPEPLPAHTDTPAPDAPSLSAPGPTERGFRAGQPKLDEF